MRNLGTLEAEVMRHLWARDGSASVRDVLDVLNESRPGQALAYTTVMTVLENLRRKGFLAREKDGRAFRYRPSLSREQHTAELLDGALDGSTDRGAALLHFVERLSAQELSELREALQRADPSEDL